MVKVLVENLKSNNKKVATAESCTGGLLAQKITSIPGASEVFDCGVVAYSNEIKTSVLGVNEETLNIYGAVSEQTAGEMATGVIKLSNADIGVGITGIAGPGGGSAEKPIGLVYIATATQSDVVTKRFLFDGDRESVREQSTKAAVMMVMAILDPVKEDNR